MASSKIKHIYLLLLFLPCLVTAADFLGPQAPIIGVISTPGEDLSDPKSTINATYIEWIEAGGGKAIPIPWDMSEDRLNHLLKQVNGVLFTGGSAAFWIDDKGGKRTSSPFHRVLNHIKELAIYNNKQGIHYPLWGICQGAEALALSYTHDLYALDNFDHIDTFDKVKFTPEAKQSVMFHNFDPKTFKYLENNDAMYFFHEYGLSTSAPSRYPSLDSDKWRVTATGKDNKGQEFIAAMESREHPIGFFMFHGEKTLWNGTHDVSKKPPAKQAVQAVKLLAQTFVNEASKNDNNFANKAVLDSLQFQNFPLTKVNPLDHHYTFDKSSLDEKFSTGVIRSNVSYLPAIGIIFALMAIVGYFSYKMHSKHIKGGSAKEEHSVNYEPVRKEYQSFSV